MSKSTHQQRTKQLKGPLSISQQLSAPRFCHEIGDFEHCKLTTTLCSCVRSCWFYVNCCGFAVLSAHAQHDLINIQPGPPWGQSACLPEGQRCDLGEGVLGLESSAPWIGWSDAFQFGMSAFLKPFFQIFTIGGPAQTAPWITTEKFPIHPGFHSQRRPGQRPRFPPTWSSPQVARPHLLEDQNMLWIGMGLSITIFLQCLATWFNPNQFSHKTTIWIRG